jgi:hypothetical protein
MRASNTILPQIVRARVNGSLWKNNCGRRSASSSRTKLASSTGRSAQSALLAVGLSALLRQLVRRPFT